MKILVLPGDGIGPEISQATLTVLDRANALFKLGLEWQRDEIGFVTLKKEGTTLPPRVMDAARVAAGPTFSPLATIATRVITPRLNLNHKFVPGPPKRFAQTIGLTFAATALALTLLGFSTAAQLVIAALIVAAFLEAAIAICLGCIAFSFLMKLGVIPQSVCESCNDISLRVLA